MSFFYDNERVHYQAKNKQFVNDATKVIKEIFKVCNNTGYHKLVTNTRFTGDLRRPMSDLQQLIRDRFGIRIVLVDEYGPYVPAAVYAHMFDVKSVVIQNSVDLSDGNASVKRVLKSIETMKRVIGTEEGLVVDLKNARMVNLPESFEVRLLLHPPAFMKHPPEEFVAVILHEIGHIFGVVSYQNRIVTNSIRLINNTNLVDKVDDTVNISSSESDRKNLSLVIDLYKENLMKPSDEEYASLASNEIMADNFAVQFGLGKELVTALEHMGGKTYGVIMESFVFLLLMVYVSILTAIVPPPVIFILGTVGMALVNMILGLPFAGTRDDGTDTYGSARDRIKRIRQGMIENLHLTKDKDEVRGIIESLDALDKSINLEYADRKVLDTLMVFFKDDLKDESAHIELIRQLEELVNNDAKIASNRINYYLGD